VKNPVSKFAFEWVNLCRYNLVKGMMDCLYAQCVPHITDCVMVGLIHSLKPPGFNP
jgi:hypothetical protein